MAYLLSLKKEKSVARIFSEVKGVIYEARESEEGTEYFRVEFLEGQSENPTFVPLNIGEASQLGLVVVKNSAG